MDGERKELLDPCGCLVLGRGTENPSCCEPGLLARHGATQTLPDGPVALCLSSQLCPALPALLKPPARLRALDTSAHSRDSHG